MAFFLYANAVSLFSLSFMLAFFCCLTLTSLSFFILQQLGLCLLFFVLVQFTIFGRSVVCTLSCCLLAGQFLTVLLLASSLPVRCYNSYPIVVLLLRAVCVVHARHVFALSLFSAFSLFTIFSGYCCCSVALLLYIYFFY